MLYSCPNCNWSPSLYLTSVLYLIRVILVKVGGNEDISAFKIACGFPNFRVANGILRRIAEFVNGDASQAVLFAEVIEEFNIRFGEVVLRNDEFICAVFPYLVDNVGNLITDGKGLE